MKQKQGFRKQEPKIEECQGEVGWGEINDFGKACSWMAETSPPSPNRNQSLVLGTGLVKVRPLMKSLLQNPPSSQKLRQGLYQFFFLKSFLKFTVGLVTSDNCLRKKCAQHPSSTNYFCATKGLSAPPPSPVISVSFSTDTVDVQSPTSPHRLQSSSDTHYCTCLTIYRFDSEVPVVYTRTHSVTTTPRYSLKTWKCWSQLQWDLVISNTAVNTVSVLTSHLQYWWVESNFCMICAIPMLKL